jgi:hypothetical protein
MHRTRGVLATLAGRDLPGEGTKPLIGPKSARRDEAIDRACFNLARALAAAALVSRIAGCDRTPSAWGNATRRRGR